jgi:biopolymer transport protein ExbD
MARKRHDPSEFEQKMNMTPLIDCVFLLIMFFILTTAITVDIEDVQLPFAIEGKPEQAVSQDIVIVLNVRLTKDQVQRGDAEIVFGGELMTPERLKKELQREVSFDMSETGRGRAPEIGPDGRIRLSQLKVRIRADKHARAEYLRTIFTACAEIDPKIYRIEVATEPPSSN